MLKFTRDDYVDTESYEHSLNYNGLIYVDLHKLNQALDYNTITKNSLFTRLKRLMSFNSAGVCRDLSREALVNYLQKFEGCPEHYFKKRGVQGASVDMKKVIEPLYANGYANEFLEMYMDFVSAKSRISSINSVLKAIKSTDLVNRDGKKLYTVGYSVNSQVNRRYNYNNIDIISQFPKDLDGKVCHIDGSVSSITCPEGYCLAYGDFAQSDLRIAFSLLLKDKSNEQMMLRYKDKYEAIARLVAAKAGKPFDLEQFKKDRNKYKVHVLETIYGTKNTVVFSEKEFISILSEFVNNCPKYVEYKKRVNDIIDLGTGLVTTSYFGYEQSIPMLGKNSTQTMNFALNSPCQTGTSELIILTTNKILEMFYDLGYSEEDVSLYITRHDEPVFLLKEEVLKDAWVFEQARTILVDDWIPLDLTFNYGYYYKIPDEDLERRAQESIEANRDKIDVYEPNTDLVPYYPVKKIATLFAHYETVGDTTIATVVSKELDGANYHLIKSVNVEEINNTLLEKIKDTSELLYKLGYTGVLVKSNYLVGELYSKGIFIKCTEEHNQSLYEVDALTKNMCNQYAMKNGEECPFSQQDLSSFGLRDSLNAKLKVMIENKEFIY